MATIVEFYCSIAPPRALQLCGRRRSRREVECPRSWYKRFPSCGRRIPARSLGCRRPSENHPLVLDDALEGVATGSATLEDGLFIREHLECCGHLASRIFDGPSRCRVKLDPHLLSAKYTDSQSPPLWRFRASRELAQAARGGRRLPPRLVDREDGAIALPVTVRRASQASPLLDLRHG